MAQTYKILGQTALAGGSNVILYTVPTATQAIISTINICNLNAIASTVRVWTILGTTAVNQAALHYDLAFPANDTFAYTAGITLQEGNSIVVESGTNNISFQAFGSEI